MSANILDGITPTLVSGTTESDGIYHHAARTDTSGHDDWLRYILPEQPALSANQTFHVGLSVKGASANSASLIAGMGYWDAAWNVYWATSDFLPIDTSWGRAEGTIVVPSGMTPFRFYVAACGTCPETWMASPTLCYGSTGIVMAAGSVTVASITDVASTSRYYLLQSSTLAAPSKPTASPPGGSWQVTEPTYTEGSTNSLYTCDQTIFSDGTWAYSDVSLSTSYEAAKAAYNKAAAAAAAAATTAQHFWADTDGAHISSTGDHDTSGFHQLMSSVKNAFMHGTTELMTISENLIELGKNSTTSIIKLCDDMLRMQYWSDKNLFELAANYGEADTHQNLALSFFNKTTGDFDERGAGLEFIPVGVNNHTAAEMCFWILCDTLKINVSNIRIGSEEYPISRLATAIQPVVLYDGYTLDNITLPESTANFSDIRIYYNANGQCRGSVDVHNPDGKYDVQMHGMFKATDTIAQYRFRAVYIQGNEIKTQSSGYANFHTSGSFDLHFGNNNVFIERVVGWR